MKKVSVIVPIYNVEAYIKRCVSSLLKQNYGNIEIILVNDGSPDNSSEIIDELAKTDDRIIVIHKENGGVSSARNAGLDIASGEYVMFVDGDDYVDENYVTYFLKLVNMKESKIGFNKNNYVNERHSRTNGNSFSEVNSEKATKYIYLGNVFVAVWNKIYNLQYLNDHKIRFNEEIWYGEGMLFNIQALQYTDTIAIGNTDVYHQVQNPNSAMRNFNLNSNHCGIKSMYLQKEALLSRSKGVLKAWNYHLWCFNISIMSGLSHSHTVSSNQEEYDNCARNIRKGFFIPFGVRISLKQRIFCCLWSLFPYQMAKRNS